MFVVTCGKLFFYSLQLVTGKGHCSPLVNGQAKHGYVRQPAFFPNDMFSKKKTTHGKCAVIFSKILIPSNTSSHPMFLGIIWWVEGPFSALNTKNRCWKCHQNVATDLPKGQICWELATHTRTTTQLHPTPLCIQLPNRTWPSLTWSSLPPAFIGALVGRYLIKKCPLPPALIIVFSFRHIPFFPFTMCLNLFPASPICPPLDCSALCVTLPILYCPIFLVLSYSITISNVLSYPSLSNPILSESLPYHPSLYDFLFSPILSLFFLSSPSALFPTCSSLIPSSPSSPTSSYLTQFHPLQKYLILPFHEIQFCHIFPYLDPMLRLS